MTTVDIVKYLDDEIRLHNGFVGVLLEEDIVKRLEKEAMDQNIDLRIFFLIAVDNTGHHVLMVPKERADAKTFSSQKALWDNVGKIKLEEAEDVEIFRWLNPSVSAAVRGWCPDPNGPLCLSRYHSVKSK